MKDYLIIVAGGTGNRMNAALPKQFIELAGLPVVMHTMMKFHAFNPELELILVLHAEYVDFWNELFFKLQKKIPHRVVTGGDERFHSVKNALDSITDETGIVGIHDAVRPLVSFRTIESGFAIAREKGTAVPCIMLNDSIRLVEGEHNTTMNRHNVRIVQTPQCFELNILRNAYQQPYDVSFTDDASVVEASGEKINLVEGNRENIKITTREDLRLVEVMLNDAREGN